VKKHEVRITIFIAGVSCQDLSGGGVQGEGWIKLSALNKMKIGLEKCNDQGGEPG